MPQQIVFPLEPPFTLSFQQYIDAKREREQLKVLSTPQRIGKIALIAIDLVSFLFVAMARSAYGVLSTVGTSFKYVVLGHYGSLWRFRPPATIYLAIFRVAFWVLGMAWCFTTTTGRLLYEHMHDGASTRALLSQFAGPEIDVAHIQTKELAINVRGIPSGVTVGSLIPLFDQINFTHDDRPGYMKSTSRQEGATTYTPEQLKQSLEVFIDYVNRRVAFLGTPPGSDTPRLMDFYQQIENAVRFSIHAAATNCAKANRELEEFMIAHDNIAPAVGSDDRAAYEKLGNEVNDSLQAQARIGINLALAGLHCGARYMGESMELYDSFNQEASLGQGTLEEALIEVLAAKRKEIARAQIQTHLGTDTHDYNNYMSSLGHILAIPGTKNIIEHLSRGLDRSRFLKLFFEKYTVDCIREAITDKIKKSQAFREKITDWLRDNPGNWNKLMSDQELVKRLAELNPILQQKQIAPNSPIYQNFLQLQALITHLKQQKALFPDVNQDFDDFLSNLFALPAAQTWLPTNLIEKAQIKQKIKLLFSDEQLGQALIEKVKEGSVLQLKDFRDRFLELQKVSGLCAKMHIDKDVALRIIKGENRLVEAIAECRELARGPDFLAQLVDPDQMVAHGLSKELMEWIQVSQKVLLPQE